MNITKVTNRPKAIISITSYRGVSSGAMHYYGRLCIIGFENIELFRPITQEEIERFPDRFYHYKDGDLVNAFNAWEDVIVAGADKAKEKDIDLSGVAVEGIPNTPLLSYCDAIKPLDTRPKCKKCGKVIKPREGCYNTPRGLFCTKCY